MPSPPPMRALRACGPSPSSRCEDRERTLDSPTDKIMLSLATYADELEREKARQRTKDALVRKARRGYVTGGRCFGYRNVEILGPGGERSHVEREIIEEEAEVVRRIFQLCVDGLGQRKIAHTLNRCRSWPACGGDDDDDRFLIKLREGRRPSSLD